MTDSPKRSSVDINHTKKQSRIDTMLGFAMRAGKLILGTDLVCRAMPSGKVKLCVIASGASAPTKKKLTTKSEFYSIPKVFIEKTPEALGALLGKSHPTAAVAVTDAGFASEIIKAAEMPESTI